MNVLLIEPYFTGSHAQWVRGYARYSRHRIDTLQLSGANWKWRMHGGALTLARRFMESRLDPDVIVASDMLDLTTFAAVTRARTARVPMAVYFHENQLSYPWSPDDRDVAKDRDKHYGFINYASALAADGVFFNSNYHLESFFAEARRLLKHFPDHNELGSLDRLSGRSSVLPLGLELRRLDDLAAAGPGGARGDAGDGPLVVWNHRWEYDKNPAELFSVLESLAGEGVPFRVAVLGERFGRIPPEFDAARRRLGERVVKFGYEADPAAYASWLRAGDVLPVTSRQDFFGAAVVEAVYCGCRPLLPDRLAYRELIPEEFHEAVFYRDGADLERRLRSTLLAPEPPPGGLSGAMRRFDWERMAPRYDRAFERVARGGGRVCAAGSALRTEDDDDPRRAG